MSKRNRWKRTNNRSNGGFIMLPHAIYDHPVFISLGPSAKWLLLELIRQFNGNNNGSQSAAWDLLKNRGWKSKGTVNSAKKELLASGLVAETRQGGLRPMLHSTYALGWLNIDPVDELEYPWTKMVGKRSGTWPPKK